MQEMFFTYCVFTKGKNLFLTDWWKLISSWMVLMRQCKGGIQSVQIGVKKEELHAFSINIQFWKNLVKMLFLFRTVDYWLPTPDYLIFIFLLYLK